MRLEIDRRRMHERPRSSLFQRHSRATATGQLEQGFGKGKKDRAMALVVAAVKEASSDTFVPTEGWRHPDCVQEGARSLVSVWLQNGGIRRDGHLALLFSIFLIFYHCGPVLLWHL